MQDFFLTKGLSSAEKAELEKMLPPAQKFKKGEIIYCEEHFLKAIGVIVSGRITIKTDESGRTLLRTLGVGDTFGVSAVFSSEEQFVSNVSSMSDCEIIFLDESVLSLIFARFPSTVKSYIELLSSKIRFLNRKIGILSTKSTQQRLYEYLLSICTEEGIANLPSMTAVCKTLGIGRSSLYRGLDLLTEKGLIEKTTNTVKVIDYEKNS